MFLHIIMKQNHLWLNIYFFYSIDTGVWKEYDANGNVIKEEDMDAYYKITINDFVNLMKEQYIRLLCRLYKGIIFYFQKLYSRSACLYSPSFSTKCLSSGSLVMRSFSRSIISMISNFIWR